MLCRAATASSRAAMSLDAVVGVGCHLATEADHPPAHQSEDTNSLEVLFNNEYLYATYMQ